MAWMANSDHKGHSTVVEMTNFDHKAHSTNYHSLTVMGHMDRVFSSCQVRQNFPEINKTK